MDLFWHTKELVAFIRSDADQTLVTVSAREWFACDSYKCRHNRDSELYEMHRTHTHALFPIILDIVWGRKLSKHKPPTRQLNAPMFNILCDRILTNPLFRASFSVSQKLEYNRHVTQRAIFWEESYKKSELLNIIKQYAAVLIENPYPNDNENFQIYRADGWSRELLRHLTYYTFGNASTSFFIECSPT